VSAARTTFCKGHLTANSCKAYFPFVRNDVRKLRTEAALSQGELATRLGVSRQTVNAIETGRYSPSLPLAIAIARLFGKPVEVIFHVDHQS
jgi:putative transcriptional regulator